MLTLIVIFATTVPLNSVYAAAPEYARAAVRNAYFFTEMNDSSALFSVPYTYCVEILKDEGDWYRARYAANAGIYREITGYCRKDDFIPVEGVPDVTYLYKTVTVTYAANSTPSTLPVLNEIAVEAAYYGTYDSGAAVYSYVYCQGSFGYIEGANDDYPLNSLGTETGDGGNKEESKNLGWSAGLITVAVILALFVAVIMLLHFATAKANKKDL